MKQLILVFIALLSFCAVVALPQQAGQTLTWAYPVPDKNPPPAGDPKELKRLPGSTKSYTQAQIDARSTPRCRGSWSMGFRSRPADPAT